ncbi:Ref family recombination enhancement nuclease [Atlantibacter hermannii]|uniref:Ref family recombination enhancement nuclease n=1 Tax=Atlantibacter hermannii TaxID=565 RepID=UPI0028966C12|nr:Ref family recombination enhancement nuclease [Atlantibacter hermannii]
MYRFTAIDKVIKNLRIFFIGCRQMDATNERYEKQRCAAERQRERAKAKMADPAYQQHQKEKRQAAAERQRERQREKRREAALKPKNAVVAGRRKKTSRGRGLKGRTPTAAEKRVMDALARLPCVACSLHGQFQPVISLHHIDGRVKPGAHGRVLPICSWHHQEAAPQDIRDRFPWLVPVHACGSTGGKAMFTALNASEEELLQVAYEQAGLTLDAA